jgi:hypothetical protein
MRAPRIRRGTARRWIAVLVVAGALAACSSDASSSSSSLTGAALEAAKGAVCSNLIATSSALGSAVAGQTGELQTKAESLASGLLTAAGALKAVGGGTVADDITSVATDIQQMATEAPAEMQSKATDAKAKVDAAATSLACPGASPAG